jgi:hypothetical protein
MQKNAVKLYILFVDFIWAISRFRFFGGTPAPFCSTPLKADKSKSQRSDFRQHV